MTHGFALRLQRDGAQAVPQAARDRMADRGWTCTAEGPSAMAAVSGAAGIAQAGDLRLCGMAFLEDRAPLLARLGLTDAEAQSLGDLDILARLRVAEGPDFAAELSGAFAFVVLDLAGGRIEGWRDPFGLYPFFYTEHEGALTFGSDIRACLHLAGLPLAPDPRRIADFLSGTEGRVTHTAFEGLWRLPAAHRLESGAGTALRTTPYWTLTPPPPEPSEGAPERLRAALEAATDARMRRPETVGAMLSGGLDSTALAGLAAQAAADASAAPLRTLSFVYGADKAYDESRFIAAAEETFGTAPHRIAVTGAPALDEIGPLVEEQMELFLAPGLQKSRRIYAEARALGLDAVIDGHGGDEVISHGYGRLAELAARRRFGVLYREARGAARVHGTPFWALYLGHVAHNGGLRPGHPLRRLLMRIVRRQMRDSMTAGSDPGLSLVAPGQRARIEAETAEQKAQSAGADPLHAERAAHLVNLTNPLLIESFEVLHRSATAAGVLPLYPFLDRRVVTLCLALGAETKLQGGQTRWVLREAMRGLMPEIIRTRPDKAEFGSELTEAVTRHWRNRPIDDTARMAGHVDTDAAEALRNAVLSGAHADVRRVRALWRLAVLEQWLAAFDAWREAQAGNELL